MTAFDRTLAAWGLSAPSPAQWSEAAVAGAIILVALAVGWFAGRWLHDHAQPIWQRWFGKHAEGVGDRIGQLIRHGTAALLLAIAGAARPWDQPAAFMIGFVLAAAVARLVIQTLRGLGVARWLARAVALALFAMMVARALGGADSLTGTLGAVGVDLGSRRISLLSVASALVTLVVLYAAVRLVNRMVGATLQRSSSFDPTQRVLAEKLAGIAVLIIAFFLAIDLIGIDLTAFAIFSGAFGLAIGFGFQKTFGNLISGIILLMDRSIKPGDVIVVGESVGWVNKIGARAVSVITRDGKEHLIPNEILMTTPVENWSFSDRNVRVHVEVRIAYDCDVALAQRLLMQAATDSPRVLKDPNPNVWMTELGDNGIGFDVLCWINDPESGVGNVKSDVLNRIWALFQEHGIRIPYPQHDLHVRSLPPPVAP